MKTLIIIRGAPGSGKTTVAKAIAASTNGVIFEADQYFVDGQGHYNYDRSKIKDAHRWCYEQVRGEVASSWKRPVIVSNTFTKLWEFDDYIKLACDFGIPFNVIECKGRFPNNHDVPDETVLRMRDTFEPYKAVK